MTEAGAWCLRPAKFHLTMPSVVLQGADRAAAGARGADLAHRILRGAKPSNLPVEQLASIRTILNLKTARASGVEVRESIRLQADEVIE